MSPKGFHKKPTEKTHSKCSQKQLLKRPGKRPSKQQKRAPTERGKRDLLNEAKTWRSVRKRLQIECYLLSWGNGFSLIKNGCGFKNVGDRLKVDREMTNLKKEQIKF